MNEQNGSGLKFTTTCKLPIDAKGTPCGFPITDHPLNVAIIGQPDARIQNFIGALMKHVSKKHPEAFQLAQLNGQFFFGYLIMSAFDSPDPALEESRKKFEATMRRMITPHPVNDDEIEAATAVMGLTMDDPHRRPFISALQHLRDYYEGKTPQLPADSPAKTLILP
jgi:hypothetical protein